MKNQSSTLHFLCLFFCLFTVKAKSAGTDSSQSETFTLHAQSTIINQFKPAFKASYTGLNSLSAAKEQVTSITSTLFAGVRLWKGSSVYINPEIAGGSGLSEALGIADATNGETFRVGEAAPKIYLARLFFNQIFPLSKEYIHQESDLNQLRGDLPTKYLSVSLGKVGIADFFDDNDYSHDPRTQFLSWSLMDNGAWDYPANTRGYTPSAVVEYVTPNNEWRYGFSLVPLTANGQKINYNFWKASSHSLEYTHHYKLGFRKGSIRLLAFFTSANMGDYRTSVALSPSHPDIIQTRQYGNTKYGFTLNAEQELTHDLGMFLRAGWNDGHHETWAFTEIDRTLSVGFNLTGARWHRANDDIGLAVVSSGLSLWHRQYLQQGGYGFMLGDGKLRYGFEHLGEVYYSTELLKEHVYLSGVYQMVLNPGYNRDRQGPVHVLSIRLHTKI